MASLKFSSNIEHICLQVWNLSTSWLEGYFNIWTLTDTIPFAMLALLFCVQPYHHLTIAPNGFCPAISSLLTSILFSSHIYFTPLYFFLLYSTPCFSILLVLESSMLFPQETPFPTDKMKYHKALSLPHAHAPARDASGTYPHTHGHGVRPEVPPINHHYRAFS